MTMIVESRCREVVDGVEYNVTHLRGENGTATIYDPVRTAVQQEKRDRELRAAAAQFGRAALNQNGEEWFRKHLLVE